MNTNKLFLSLTVLTTLIAVLKVEAEEFGAFFHRQGQNIIHPNGKPFRIRGVNVSCWLYQENYVLGGAQTAQKLTTAKVEELVGRAIYQEYVKSMMDSFLTASDIRTMKRMGINCIRIGFDAVLFNNETSKAWFFNSIDRLLPVLMENDIAFIPIMMVPPKPPDKLWCTGYVKRDTLLWDSPTAQKRTIAIWSEIAEHYKNEPMLLGYDLIGEPNIQKKQGKELIDFYREISASIRLHDSHHMIIYEGNNFAIDLEVLAKYDELLDQNACYSFHLYTWFGLKMKNHLPRFMKNAGLRNRPVFCGEWGINRISSIEEQVRLMDGERDLDGWTLYMWKALELPKGKEEKTRPPYYGNWFFIPFEKLHMSLLTFPIEPPIRDVVDWMSNVKNARTPSPETLRSTLDTIVRRVTVERCSFNRQLIEAVGFHVPSR
jgi:endoglucanase